MLSSALSRVTSAVLTKFLGGYFEGLDPSHLSIQIRSGNVQLNDVRLKPGALDVLELPVDVKDCVLGSLSIHIPWLSITKDPVVIRVSDLYVLLRGRLPNEGLSKSEAEQKNYESKEVYLHLAELTKADMPKKEDIPGKEEPEAPGFFEKLGIKVLEKLEVFFNRTHVRFEDDVSNKTPFAMGVTLDHIRIQSMDDEWRSLLGKIDQSNIRKLVKLENFAAYVDPNTKLFEYSRNDIVAFQKMMWDLIYTSTNKVKEDFVLNPLSFNIRATISTEKEVSRPNVRLDAVVDDIGIMVDPHQYRSVFDAMNMIQYFQNRLENKPTPPPKDMPRSSARAQLWWKFAIETIRRDLADRDRRSLWKDIKQRSIDCGSYVRLFKIRQAHGESKMNPTDHSQFIELQHKYPYDVLVAWRRIANTEILLAQKEKFSPRKWVSSWFNWATSWYSKEKQSEEDEETAAMHELQAMMPSYDPEEEKKKQKFLPKEQVTFALSAVLQDATVVVKDQDSNDIGDLILNKLSVQFSQRAGGQISVSSVLHSFRVSDRSDISGDSFDLIAADAAKMKKPPPGGFPTDFLMVSIDSKPLSDKGMDLAAVIDTQPIFAAVSLYALQQFMQFYSFVSAQKSRTYVPEPTLKPRKKPKLNLRLKADIHPITVVIPHDLSNPKGRALVLSLDGIVVNSNIKAVSSSSPKDAPIEYDSHTLAIRQVSCCIAQSQLALRRIRKRDQTIPPPWQVISPFDLILALEINNESTPTTPLVKVAGRLPMLEINANAQCFEEFAALAVAAAPPPQPSVPVAPRSRKYSENEVSNRKALPQVFALDFNLQSVHIALSDTRLEELKTDEKANALIEIQGNDIGASLVTNEDQGARIKATLAELSITEPSGSMPIVRLSGSGGESVVLDLTQTPSSSPLYAGFETDMTIELSREVVVNIDRFLVTRLTQFFIPMMDTFGAMPSDATQTSSSTSKSSMRILPSFDKVTINLLNQNETFISLAASKFFAEIIMDDAGGIEVEGGLGGLTVQDMKHTRWSTMLNVGDTRIEFKSSPPSTTSKASEYKITAQVSQLEAMIVTPTLMDVANYIQNMISSLPIPKEPPSKPKSAPTQAFRLKVNVGVMSPKVSIPCLKPGGEELIVALSKISAANELSDSGKVIMQIINVNFDELTVISKYNVDSTLQQTLLLPPTDISVALHMPMSPIKDQEISQMELSSDIQKIEFVIAPPQIVFLARLCTQNILLPPEIQQDDISPPRAKEAESSSTSSYESSDSKSRSSTKRPLTLFATRLKFKEISLTLLKEALTVSKGYHPKFDDAVVAFAIQKVDASFALKDNQETKVELKISDFCFTDERPASRGESPKLMSHVIEDNDMTYSPRLAHKKDLTPNQEKKEKPGAIFVSLLLTPQKNTFEAGIDHVRIVPLPDAIGETLALIMPMKEELQETFKDAPKGPPSQTPLSTKSFVPTEISAHVKSIRVVALRTDVPKTDGVVFYVANISCEFRQPEPFAWNLVTTVSEIEFLHTQFHRKTKLQPTSDLTRIARPLTATLTMETSKDQPIAMQVSVTALFLVLSHTDVLAMFLLYGAWAPALYAMVPKKESEKKDPKPVVKSVDYEEHKITEKEVVEEVVGEPIVVVNSDASTFTKNPTVKNTFVVSMHLANFSLICLDDDKRKGVLATPLIRLGVARPLAMQLSLFETQRMQVHAKCEDFSVGSYLTREGLWEPVIEPWTVDVAYDTTDNGVGAVQVIANTKLEITVAASLMETVFYFLRVKNDFTLKEVPTPGKKTPPKKKTIENVKDLPSGEKSNSKLLDGFSSSEHSDKMSSSEEREKDESIEHYQEELDKEGGRQSRTIHDVMVNLLPSSSTRPVVPVLKDEDQEAVAPPAETVRPLVSIKNEIDFPLLFWTHDSKKKHKLAPQAQKDLKLPPVSRVSSNPDDFEISFVINRPDAQYVPITVSWNVAKTTVFHKISPLEPSHRLAVEIVEGKHGNIVVIRSDECIYNKTQIPIQVHLSNIDHPEETLSGTIEPGNKLGLPFSMTSGSAVFHFRPTNQFNWAPWSPAKPNHVFECTHKTNSKQHFVASAVLKEEEHQGLLSFSIIIQPRLIIQNCFLNDLEYQVWEINKAESVKNGGLLGKVESQQSLEVFELPAADDALGFAFKLPSFSWSNPKLVREMKGDKKFFAKQTEHPFAIPVKDDEGRPLDVGVDAHYDGTSYKIVMYCKYWVINHTGLPLFYANGKRLDESAAGQDKDFYGPFPDFSKRQHLWYPKDNSVPSYYEGAPKNIFYFGEDKLKVRVGDTTEYSKPVGMVSHNNAQLSCKSISKGVDFMFTVSVKAAPGIFWRTNVLRIYPKFVVVNLTKKDLYCRPASSTEEDFFTINPSTQVPLHLPAPTTKSIFFNSTNDTDWSTPVDLEHYGMWQVRCMKKNKGREVYFNVEQRVTSMIRYIIVRDVASSPLYMVRNLTKYTMLCWEGAEDDNSDETRIEHMTEADWFWINPHKEKLELSFKFVDGSFESKTRTVNFNHLKTHGSIKVLDNKVISLAINLHGPTKTLECVEVTRQEDLQKKLLEKKIDSTLEINIRLKAIGISVVDLGPAELMYVHIGDLKADMSYNEVLFGLEVKITDFQVDNSLYLTPSSIILHSPKIDKPFLHFSATVDTRYSGITLFRYLSLAVQEVYLRIDQIFLMHAFDFYAYVWKRVMFLSSKKESKSIMSSEEYNVLRITPKDLESSSFVYYEFFYMNPVRAKVSYTSVERPLDLSLINDTAVDMMLQFGNVVGNLSDAGVKLKGLCMKHVFSTWDQFAQRVVHHYVASVLREIYTIIGSAELLGNPVGLVKGMGEGVMSFFYEPAKAIVSSPRDFGLGVAKGTRLLIFSVFEGIFGSTYKVTTHASMNMERATFDQTYRAKRATFRQKKAKHLGDGVWLGMKGLGFGVSKGVTGVVTQPVKGAREEGFVGALKGTGRGLAGAVVKPTVGFVDLFARTIEGIANTPGYFNSRNVTRIRDPRSFDIDLVIRPYDSVKAEGQLIMRTLEDGIFSKHVYLFHEQLSDSRLVLITNKVVAFLKTPKVKAAHSSAWEVAWSFPITRLQDPIQDNETTIEVVAFEEFWTLVQKILESERPLVIQKVYDYIKALHKPNIDFEKLMYGSAEEVEVDQGFEPLMHKDVFEGSLKKLKTEGLRKGTWHSHYCRVNDGNFFYYPIDHNDKVVTIPLSSCFCISCDGEKDKEDAFTLVSKPGEAVYFQADSSWMCQVWVDACIANGAHCT